MLPRRPTVAVVQRIGNVGIRNETFVTENTEAEEVTERI